MNIVFRNPPAAKKHVPALARHDKRQERVYGIAQKVG